MSRRQVLRWIGGVLAGAALARFPGSAFAAAARGKTELGVPVQHGVQLRGLLLPRRNRSLEGRFGLMFKRLPAFEPPDELLSRLAASMEEPRDAPPSVTDVLPLERFPAGHVLLGQFIDHDLTFDNTPLREQQQDPLARTNFRTARFDLDSLYGEGPSKSPVLYDRDDPAKLRLTGLADPDTPDDLPRREDGSAVIGDPRNDENLVVSQLHVAFAKFHNALVDHVRALATSGADEVFQRAQRLCRWHYQWMVVHDFLPRVVGQDTVDAILKERAEEPAMVELDFYHPKNPQKPMMPIEFAVAAYRFGHSMLRPAYVINEDKGKVKGQAVEADLFGEPPTASNLNGKRPCPPRLAIDWRFFFDIPGKEPPVNADRRNAARRLDSDLSVPLFTLPTSVVPPPDTRVSLAERNLLRGKKVGLPSGQRVAREMDLEVLSNEQLGLGNDPGWEGQAPLWFYVLKEAELQQTGERLGAVGSKIVAEVFLGLLNLDRNAYLRQAPLWRPQPPIASVSGRFGMGDLLEFAGAA
jgi:Animal haem peroxidase